jgi:hypothetical protein
LTFVGLDVAATPTVVTLSLHWRAASQVHHPYVLSLVSIAPDGSPRGNPNWDYPPSCWSPGREFVDTVQVPLGNTPQPGDWLFSLSISDAYTHEATLITGPDGQPSPQIGIGPMNVPAGE